MNLVQLAVAGHHTLMSMPILEVPNPGAGTAPPGFGKFTTMMGWSKWVALGALVVALMVQGATMGFGARRGDGGEHGKAIGYVLVGVMVVSAAWSIVGFIVS